MEHVENSRTRRRDYPVGGLSRTTGVVLSALLVTCLLTSTACESPAPVVPPEIERLESLILARQYTEAEDEARSLLASATPADDEPLFSLLVADLLVESLLRQGRGNEPETLELVDRTLEAKLERLSPDDASVGKSRMLRGRVLQLAGRYPEAEEELSRAAAIAQRQFGKRSVPFASVRQYQGGLLYRQGRYEEALTAATQALGIFEEIVDPDHPEMIDSLILSAMLHKKTGDLDTAMAENERVLEIQRRTYRSGHPDLAITLNNLGNLLRAMGDYDRARELLSEALSIKQAEGGPPSTYLAYLTLNLAIVHDMLGDLDTAVELHRQALSLMEELLEPDHQHVAAALDNYGTALMVQGDYAAARPLLDRALRIRDKPGADRSQIADSLQNLGSLSLLLGDQETAEQQFRRAHAEASDVLGVESADAARALTNIARVVRLRGEIEAATRLQEEAVGHAGAALGPYHATVAAYRVDLADMLLELGDAERAEALATPALKTLRAGLPGDHPDIAKALMVLARVRFATDDPGAGRQRLVEATRMRERLQGAGTSRALIESLQALAVAEWQIGGRDEEALDVARRCELLERRLVLDTVGSLAGSEALRFASGLGSGLDAMISVHVDQTESGAWVEGDRTATIWNEAVRSRSLILDALASRRELARGSANVELTAIVEEARKTSRRVSFLVTRGPDPDDPGRHAQELEAAIEARRRVERRWGEESRSFERVQRRQQLSLRESMADLPRDAALVAFVRYGRLRIASGSNRGSGPLPGIESEPSYVAFVGFESSAAPVTVPLGLAAHVDAAIVRWRDQLSADPRARALAGDAEDEYRAVAGELREAIWDPLEPYLRGKRMIFLVPDGDVNLVSFGTLPSPQGGYLLEGERLFHYLTTERDLVRRRVARSERQRLLLMGAPEFAMTGAVARARSRGTSAEAPDASGSDCGELRMLRFQPLPGTLGEVDDIETLWGSERIAASRGEVTRLTGALATEEAFKQQAATHSVLHIATHGFSVAERCAAASDSMRLTGLALSGANRGLQGDPDPESEDGLLTAQEIANLDLSNVEWAVLSACGTATGTIFDGEGVVGLRRAFEVAGARTLIMSLWDVEDEATRFWMRRLHEERLGGGHTPEALRAASQTWLSEARATGRTTHPFFWGAFVATGDWR